MALTIDEIREAALIGKSFTLTDVKLIGMSYDNGKLSLEWEIPQMQNKHYCPGMVVDYISICEKPKYDPCRRLKCGDIVELVEWNGRFPIPKSYFKDIDIKTFRVVAEECRGIVTIDLCGEAHHLPICFLKLITPVEELEPYCVRKYSSFYAVEKRNNHKDRPATYDVDNHPHAKEAAEAERDRLNDEWRKEQK